MTKSAVRTICVPVPKLQSTQDDTVGTQGTWAYRRIHDGRKIPKLEKTDLCRAAGNLTTLPSRGKGRNISKTFLRMENVTVPNISEEEDITYLCYL
jgi:hypothetical protein